jgi:hypothetical protein
MVARPCPIRRPPGQHIRRRELCDDSAVRYVDESPEVLSANQWYRRAVTVGVVHALLDHRPSAVIVEEETVVVTFVAVLLWRPSPPLCREFAG